ncbi:MAG: MarR family transcriptional regulator [Spirochaetales bacterium]
MLTKSEKRYRHEELFHVVFDVIGMLQKDLLRMDLRLDAGDLSKLHLGILGALSRYRELPVTELADKMHVVKPQMSLLLDKLEGLGLVTRSPSAQDRRRLQVALTVQGELVLAQALTRMDEALTGTLACLEDAEVEELVRSLTSAAKILKKL